MKLLILADPGSTHIIKWVKDLSKRNIQIFLYGLQECDLNDYCGLTGVEIKSEKISRKIINSSDEILKLSYLKVISKLKKIIEEYKPNILHSHYASSYGLLGRLMNFHPYFISVWGSDVFEFPRKSFLHKKLFQYNLIGADRIFSTSEIMRDELKKYTEKKIDVIPFGIDLNKFKPIDNNIPRDKEFVIGTVKALEEVYGIEYLIRAFKIIVDRYPIFKIKLLIVGEGSLQMKLMNLCSELQIENSVEFAGKISHDKLVDYYNKMDIAVFLSKSESFGVAVLEASACGKPLVVANVGGLPEVVENNITGFVVEKENPEDAAMAFEKLILNENLRKEMGMNGMKRVEKFYNWNNNVNQMINIYKSVSDE